MKQLFLFLLLLTLACPAPSAWAVLSGSVEWNYVDYDWDDDKGEDLDARSFTQNYSVFYQQSGLLNAGRLGSWTLGLGAEWSAFDSKVDGTEFDKDSLKSIFAGDLLVAPGGLPFRLHAYSYDLSPITPITDNRFGLSQRFSFFAPGITTDLRSGQTVVSGVNFLAGVRNGIYLGAYRDVLSKLPRLLFDYRDLYHRDIKGDVPVKFRQRDLAFVSLNKKDNWFHYRTLDYKDYIDSTQNKHEETFLLGTIDHLLKRQWVYLTNWMEISADGSYATLDEENGLGKEDRYDVNLFSVMNWKGVQISNFNHYSRERRDSRLTQTLDIPVYFNSRLNPDTNLRGQAIVNRWQKKIDSRVQDKEDIYYSNVKYETNLVRRTRVDYGLEAEYNTRDRGDGQGVRVDVEAYSSQVARSRFNWYGNIGLGFFSGEGEDSIDTNYWENFAAGRATYSLTKTLSVEVGQELLYGFGSIGTFTTSYLVPRSTRSFQYGGVEVARDDHYLRSQSSVAFDHRWRRISNRLAGFYKYEEDSLSSSWSFELEHRMGYSHKTLRMDMTNYFSTGDISGPVIYNEGAGEVRDPDKLFVHNSRLRFLPNRHWESSFTLDAEWRRGEGNGKSGKTDTSLIQLTQRLRRNFYAVNGVIRKLADIEQSIEYEKYMDSFDREYLYFTLSGNYYPTRLLSFGGRFEYRYYDYTRNEMNFSLTAGLHFPKFQVDFDYDYATDEDHEVVVQRYELNVRKTF